MTDATSTSPPGKISSLARSLIQNSLVWDNHTCLPLRPDDHAFFSRLDEVAKSGVNVISVNVGFGPVSLEEHRAMIDGLTRWIATQQHHCTIVRSVRDIELARTEGKLAIFFDVEGMAPLDGDRIDLIEPWRKAGVGWMLVAYNTSNEAGAGCTEDRDEGLTAYGRRIIDEMERVGMIVCCSHTGHRTARDVLEYASKPVIFSHSNAFSIHQHYRNIPDDLIDACAQTGGVVGVNGLAPFLGYGPATIERLVDHIEHIAGVAGTDHVGLGLDFVYDTQELEEYLTNHPEVFPDTASIANALSMIGPQRIGEIVDELLSRGASKDDIEKILGKNWQRVAGDVWHPA